MQKWEYLFVNAEIAGDIPRTRYVDFQELPNWKNGPSISQYANQMGEQGWELVVAPFTVVSGSDQYGNPHNVSTSFRLVFKRPKS